MKVTPVKKLQKPGYPNRYDIDFGRDVLCYRPARWSAKPAVGGLLATVMMLGLSACVPKDDEDDNQSAFYNYSDNQSQSASSTTIQTTQTTFEVTTLQTTQTTNEITTIQTTAKPATSKITTKKTEPSLPAAFFEHGYNISSYGCIVVGRSFGLTEEEAMTLITAELENAGLSLVAAKVRENANVPTPSLEIGYENEYYDTQKGAFEPDGNINGIDFELFTYGDFEKLTILHKGYSSAYVKNISKAAKTLAVKNEKLAVLFIPIIHYSENEDVSNPDMQEVSKKEAYAESEKQLRAQVLDFIEWMRAQGFAS